jgi:stage II sporulation protein D
MLSACGRREARRPVSPPEEIEPEETRDAASPTSEDRPPIPVQEPVVRVRLLKVRTGQPALRLGADGQWIELAMLNTEGADRRAGDAPPASALLVSVHRAPLQIMLTSSGWSILDALGFRPSVPGRPVLEVRPPPPDEASFVDVDGRTYPGCVRLFPRADLAPDAYDVINHVAVERYLPGVLGRELFRHWHPETFAAQAIAARSFACAEHAYFGDRRHYDLTDTASSQEYIGRVSDDRAMEAAAGTRGIVLGYGGALVPGYYSSCCGGLAADARDAIGDHPFNDVPPLRGRPGLDVCTEAPLYSWSIRRPVSDVLRRLRGYGTARGLRTLAKISSLQAIEVSSVNAHGRPRAYVIRGEDGIEAELVAERLRRALDYVPAGRSTPDPPAWSSHLQITIARGEARLDGRGHGHGAGLCQHGAEALARAGEGCPAILSWYYPGAELNHAYV